MHKPMADFDSPEKKKATLIHNLQELKDNTGWKIVLKWLDRSISIAESKLHGDSEMIAEENVDSVRRERQALIRLKLLPDLIIQENEPKEVFDPRLDPYEQ